MSSLKDKLYNYETPPPADAWEKISAALDESHLTDQFPKKLYDVEIPPPAGAWNAISAAIRQEPAAAIIPMRRRAPGFIRYAAAAILLIVAGYFIFQWSNDDTDTTGNEMAITTGDSTSDVNDQPAKIDKPVSNEVASQPAEEARLSTRPAIAATGKTTTARKGVTARSNAVEDEERMLAYQPASANLAERYVMFMTPTGNIIRMSKKWGDMVCCVTGEVQDEDCKDQLQKWQEKLATTSTTTTGGFMDVLSLVSALDNDL